MSDRLFQPPATFMRLPYLTRFDEARAVVLGLPFDCGAHPARIGSRGGPAAIRQASLDLEHGDEHSNIDAFKILNAGDAGDASDGGGEAGRAGADDDHVVGHRLAWPVGRYEFLCIHARSALSMLR